MTPQQQFEHKLKWKPGYLVDVHSDLRGRCTDYCKEYVTRESYHISTWIDVYTDRYMFEHKLDAERFAYTFRDWVVRD